MYIVNIFAVHFFANHNKDYSVVKTLKWPSGRFFFIHIISFSLSQF